MTAAASPGVATATVVWAALHGCVAAFATHSPVVTGTSQGCVVLATAAAAGVIFADPFCDALAAVELSVALVTLVPAPDLFPASGDVVLAQRPADVGLGPPLHLL